MQVLHRVDVQRWSVDEPAEKCADALPAADVPPDYPLALPSEAPSLQVETEMAHLGPHVEAVKQQSIDHSSTPLFSVRSDTVA